MVEYDAFASLDIQDCAWHLKLYRLCSRSDLVLNELCIKRQHIIDMYYPEQKIWPPHRERQGVARRRPAAGRGAGRRRSRSLRRPANCGAAVGAIEGVDAGGAAPPIGAVDDVGEAVDSADDAAESSGSEGQQSELASVADTDESELLIPDDLQALLGAHRITRIVATSMTGNNFGFSMDFQKVFFDTPTLRVMRFVTRGRHRRD